MACSVEFVCTKFWISPFKKCCILFLCCQSFLVLQNILCVWTFMRLRSGRALAEMVRPKNTSFPWNEILNTKQLVESTVGTTGNSNPIGTKELTFTPIMSVTLLPGVVVSFPIVTSILTTPSSTHTTIGDPKPSYVLGFTLPMVFRDFPYSMPTAMMAGLHGITSTYVDDNATTMSPLNPYVASESIISNLGRITQPRGFRFAPPNASALTTNFMLSIRQQMDESNHEMVNMFTHQISTLLNPLI